ncbi:DUF2934 domain-containing protein [Rhizobium sp. BK376]|uniref:DUF2934 domain-containing protein n=1 Tax=Rhizobium sp. BK376 TaxID=2512149 RepID=UPI001043F627|nr:DUF2934 domain-containing protein [Rhizobium sp. BK376]
MEVDIEETPKETDEEHVRYQAYMLWLEEGQPEGKADEHWHRARDAASAKERHLSPRARRKKSRDMFGQATSCPKHSRHTC